MAFAFPPVSLQLLEILQDEVRKRTLIVWLDAEQHYTAFVDHLRCERAEGRLNFDITGFRGSYLELMLELEPLTAGVDKQPLVIHLPGFNMATVRETPLLELYFAGKVFQKALPTLVEEAAATRVPADRIAQFIETTELTLSAADAWLADALEGDTEGLAGELRRFKLTELVRELLNADSSLASRVRQTGHKALDIDQIIGRLSSLTGATSEWLRDGLSVSKVPLNDLASNAASWALCVEYVTDLKRIPIDALLTPVSALPSAVQQECCTLAAELRKSQAEFYTRVARETEDRLPQERATAQPDDLGKIDTFPFEEDAILNGAIAALKSNQWDRALTWAEDRKHDQCFWLRSELNRRSAWQLVADAARLGQAISVAGPNLQANSLDAAVEFYVEQGSQVDQAHRRLEQRREALLYPHLPKYDAIRESLDAARAQWRVWADAWATDFNTLCIRDGFLPSPELQQRNFFEDVIHRSMVGYSQGTTVLFLIDALRFEMAQELSESLGEAGSSTIHLKARLAELPSVTEVGMNVVAPVCNQGRLSPTVRDGKFLGFSTGDFRVYDPETRKKAMHGRIGGRTCPMRSLDEVIGLSKAKLKSVIGQASLMIVDSREIDDAGHAGVGPSIFDKTLQDLRAAMHLLRDAGVHNFVITADHGFLLLPDRDHPVQSHGRKIDPRGRYVISKQAADHSNEVRVSLRDLNYDCDDLHLMFPVTTACFDTGDRDRRFVHGGNSLQERVVPVLTVQHARSGGRTTVQYQIKTEARRGMQGMHAVQATLCLESSSLGLSFGGGEQKELGLRAIDGEHVRVSLLGVSGGAKLEAGAILATVGEQFDVFFRLSGPEDARVRVELFHPGSADSVKPGTTAERFDVIRDVRPPGNADKAATTQVGTTSQLGKTAGAAWLLEFDNDGVRRVFQHIWTHAVIAESELESMLGSPREARKFARQIDDYARRIPFAVRVETVGGMKRYVREGGGS